MEKIKHTVELSQFSNCDASYCPKLVVWNSTLLLVPVLCGLGSSAYPCSPYLSIQHMPISGPSYITVVPQHSNLSVVILCKRGLTLNSKAITTNLLMVLPRSVTVLCLKFINAGETEKETPNFVGFRRPSWEAFAEWSIGSDRFRTSLGK